MANRKRQYATLSEFPAEKLLERAGKITVDTYKDAKKRMDIEILDSTDGMASAILAMDRLYAPCLY
jgi:hypothetical protein